MISIIITTTDVSNTISDCIENVLRIAGSNNEIIIAYQCKDRPNLNIRNLDGSRIKIINLPYVGLSRARNMGAKEAGHDILAFIDDDIILDENYIKNIESHMNRGVAGICGRILLPDTCLPYAKTQTEKLALINTSPYRLKKCIGGNMAFQRKPFMEIGGFDEMFGVGGKYGGAEDIDIVLRLLQKNYTVIYAPDVVGYHPKENRSDLSAFSRKSYLYGIGEGAVYSKHFFRYKLYSIMMNYLLEIIKPFTRILLRPVLMNCESNIVYLSIIGGRLSGFYKYKTQELQKKLEGKRNYDGGK